MPLELEECPWFDYSYRDEAPVLVVNADGPYRSDRYLFGLTRRVYSWHVRRTDAERLAIDDFLVRARSVSHESFYVLDPYDPIRTAVSLGNGDGVKTVFTLPTTGEESRFYPKDDALLVVRVSGAPVTVSSVDTDGRSVTLAAPPAGAAPVEIDFSGLRLCMLSAPTEWKGAGAAWFDATLAIEEILSD